MWGILGVGYFVMGIIQCVAIIDGLHVWLGLNAFITVILSIILAYFPLVGSILGMAGAIRCWHLPWFGAFCLFFWPILLFVGSLIFGFLGSRDSQVIN